MSYENFKKTTEIPSIHQRIESKIAKHHTPNTEY